MSREAPPNSNAAPAAVSAEWQVKHPSDGRWGKGAASALDALRQIERSRNPTERSRTPTPGEPDIAATDKPQSS